MFDEILKRSGLNYEDLNSAEKETISGWYQALSRNELTLDKVRMAISSMKYAVEEELIKEPEEIKIFIFSFPNRKHIFLKARLKNYLMIEAFLSTPERAKAAMEQTLASFTTLKK